MDWYYYIAWLIIASQLPYLALAIHNYMYDLNRYAKRRERYRPCVALLIPCKNLDRHFEENIMSFFNQDYDDYSLFFIVEDKEDPAYKSLCKLRDNRRQHPKAPVVQLLVAGKARLGGQKIHNLLYAYHKIPPDAEVLAFADSDICVRPNWLSHLVHPLIKDETGLASGYRWFVPGRNNPASVALSVINGKVAQLLGYTRYNQAWGGSMAIRLETFRKLGIETLWAKALSDDLTLSRAVKKAGKQVEFVPGCLVASYEQMSWCELLEFGRRQFVITKVAAPGTWWFGLLSTLYSLLGSWGTAALALCAAVLGRQDIALYIAVPVVFFAGQMTRAILRQAMVRKILGQDWPKLKIAAAADIVLFWFWTPLMLILILSSVFGRTIYWRGIRYKLISPTETEILERSDNNKSKP